MSRTDYEQFSLQIHRIEIITVSIDINVPKYIDEREGIDFAKKY